MRRCCDARKGEGKHGREGNTKGVERCLKWTRGLKNAYTQSRHGHTTHSYRCQRAPKSLLIKGRKRFRYRFFTFPRSLVKDGAQQIGSLNAKRCSVSSTAPSSNGFSLGTSLSALSECQISTDANFRRRRRWPEDLVNCRKSITCELSPRVL